MNNAKAGGILFHLLNRDADCRDGNFDISPDEREAIIHATELCRQPSIAGSVKTAKKAKSSRENGKLGGRPKKL